MIDITDWSVLIADDEPDNLSLLEDILLFFNASVTSASSGTETIEKIERNHYRMILLDIQMAKTSGWDVIRFIREHGNPEIRNLFVIAVTAHAMPGDREKILSAGFNGYISKPIDAPTFLSTIEAIVSTQKGPTDSSYVS